MSATGNVAGGRIAKRFAALKTEGRGGLITFVTAGDPDQETSGKILAGLPKAGADLIELGMPFSDPMADGPAIQLASLRALQNGASLKSTLAMVTEFRKGDAETPIVLMGYYNPVYQFGTEAFCEAAATAGVDGLIIVDLPPEESDELQPVARAKGIDIIRLTTPTSDDGRLPIILNGASGFVYHVSILGITGTRSATEEALVADIQRVRGHTNLPIAIGFGIRTPEQAAASSKVADAAVVGSAIVSRIAENLDDAGRPEPELVDRTLSLVRDLAAGVRGGAA